MAADTSRYQKKTHLEHVLLRPDSYVGSIEATTEKIFVLNKQTGEENVEKAIEKTIDNKTGEGRVRIESTRSDILI
jgi:hypothetical protein